MATGKQKKSSAIETESQPQGVDALKQIFPDWEESDLQSALSECNSDLETTIARISEGHIQQWSAVGKKPKQKKDQPSSKDSKRKEADQTQNGASRGRGRGASSAPGRGASGSARGAKTGPPPSDSNFPTRNGTHTLRGTNRPIRFEGRQTTQKAATPSPSQNWDTDDATPSTSEAPALTPNSAQPPTTNSWSNPTPPWSQHSPAPAWENGDAKAEAAKSSSSSSSESSSSTPSSLPTPAEPKLPSEPTPQSQSAPAKAEVTPAISQSTPAPSPVAQPQQKPPQKEQQQASAPAPAPASSLPQSTLPAKVEKAPSQPQSQAQPPAQPQPIGSFPVHVQQQAPAAPVPVASQASIIQGPIRVPPVHIPSLDEVEKALHDQVSFRGIQSQQQQEAPSSLLDNPVVLPTNAAIQGLNLRFGSLSLGIEEATPAQQPQAAPVQSPAFQPATAEKSADRTPASAFGQPQRAADPQAARQPATHRTDSAEIPYGTPQADPNVAYNNSFLQHPMPGYGLPFGFYDGVDVAMQQRMMFYEPSFQHTQHMGGYPGKNTYPKTDAGMNPQSSQTTQHQAYPAMQFPFFPYYPVPGQYPYQQGYPAFPPNKNMYGYGKGGQGGAYSPVYSGGYGQGAAVGHNAAQGYGTQGQGEEAAEAGQTQAANQASQAQPGGAQAQQHQSSSQQGGAQGNQPHPHQAQAPQQGGQQGAAQLPNQHHPSQHHHQQQKFGYSPQQSKGQQQQVQENYKNQYDRPRTNSGQGYYGQQSQSGYHGYQGQGYQNQSSWRQ